MGRAVPRTTGSRRRTIGPDTLSSNGPKRHGGCPCPDESGDEGRDRRAAVVRLWFVRAGCEEDPIGRWFQDDSFDLLYRFQGISRRGMDPRWTVQEECVQDKGRRGEASFPFRANPG